MRIFERLAYVVGTLLLGASTGFVLSRRRDDAFRRERPVEDLADSLKQAWAPYHNR